jgi:hypothetical protein
MYVDAFNRLESYLDPSSQAPIGLSPHLGLSPLGLSLPGLSPMGVGLSPVGMSPLGVGVGVGMAPLGVIVSPVVGGGRSNYWSLDMEVDMVVDARPGPVHPVLDLSIPKARRDSEADSYSTAEFTEGRYTEHGLDLTCPDRKEGGGTYKKNLLKRYRKSGKHRIGLQ